MIISRILLYEYISSSKCVNLHNHERHADEAQQGRNSCPWLCACVMCWLHRVGVCFIVVNLKALYSLSFTIPDRAGQFCLMESVLRPRKGVKA